MTPQDQTRQGTLDALLWAVFLASSWTWCIGMFLPAILHRDFGPASFLVFLIPNVIGAAAMGLVLARPWASESLCERHAPAIRAFSAVTVLFHLAFLVLVVLPLARLGGVGPWGVLILALPAAVAALGPERLWALLAYLVSLACLVGWAVAGGAASVPDRAILTEAMAGSALPSSHLAAMALVCVLGFALCPYLDATFHRARQRQDAANAALSFTVGFGLLFSTMVVFTAGYAAIFFESYAPGSTLPPERLVRLVVVHMSVQSALTVALHLRAIARGPSAASARPAAARLLGLLFLAAAGAATFATLGPPFPKGLAPPDGDRYAWYRVFMSFYGLLFPAYVWLVMIPTWRSGRPTARHWAVLAFAVACAAPCYWLGFMEGRTLWLLPGVAAILLSRLMIRTTGAGPAEPSGVPVPAPTRPPTLAGSAPAPRP